MNKNNRKQYHIDIFRLKHKNRKYLLYVYAYNFVVPHNIIKGKGSDNVTHPSSHILYIYCLMIVQYVY